MRMRKKKNLPSRMERASAWLLRDEGDIRRDKDKKLIAELGCGMGTFACETALARPDTEVFALERVPDAIIAGMERAMRENIKNLRFIQDDAANLPRYFSANEIDELYIHFCDPWSHWKQAGRRLVARNFLKIYRPLLAIPGKSGDTGFLKFKTDDGPLFTFAQKELAAAGWTIIHCDPDSPPEAIMTEYEKKFRSQKIPIGSLTAI